MGTLKFGIFSDSYPPIMDGVAITVRNYAYWLNKSNFQPYIITPEYPGFSDTDEFPVLRYHSIPILMRKPYRLGLPKIDHQFNQELKNIPFSLVHAHSPFSAGLLALKIARQNNIPMVATFHSKYRDDFSRFINQKEILNQILKRIISFYDAADEVWIPQPSVEDTIREYGYRGKVEVVENGVDISVDGDIHHFRSASREMLKIPQNRKVFLYVGQMVLEKNLKFLVESLRYINARDFVVYFVGEGYAKSQLENLVREYGLESKVKFTGIVYDREELKRYYAAADLFLFPSMYDNAPLVILEASAFHTPALLLRGSTISSLVKDGFNGFLSDNDPELYGDRINQLISDDVLLIRAGENASSTVGHSWQDSVREVADRYTHLISRKQNLPRTRISTERIKNPADH
ncbi:MAG: glycosyltransferase [Bacteroidota bacterium]|nr:glycosyltransferase [Bacteroidota bacterium]